MAIAKSLRQNKLSDGSQGEKLGEFCSVLRKRGNYRKTKGTNSGDRKYRELRMYGHVIEKMVIVVHACYPSTQEVAVLGFNQFKTSLSYSVRSCLKTEQK